MADFQERFFVSNSTVNWVSVCIIWGN